MPVGNDEETAKNNPRENDHRQALVSAEEGDHRRCRLGFPEEHRGAIIGFGDSGNSYEFAHLIESSATSCRQMEKILGSPAAPVHVATFAGRSNEESRQFCYEVLGG